MTSRDSTVDRAKTELAAKRRELRLGRGLAWKRRLLTLHARVFRSSEAGDHQAVQHLNEPLFQEVGVSREQATERCRATLADLGREFRPTKQSIHYLAFAALREGGQSLENILEVGTYRGETTEYLAALFPSASVYSVELPQSDPLVAEYHTDPERTAEVQTRLSKLPGFVPLRTNTLFLPQHDLPLFDLIWLDGGHYHPELAWDHFYCLHHLAKDGWLFSDDIILPGSRFYSDRRFLQAYELLEYINDRRSEPFRLLLKREDPLRFLVRPKYVAYTRNRS